MDIDFTLTTLWLCVLLLLMDIKMYFELLLYMSSCSYYPHICKNRRRLNEKILLLRVFSGWFNFIQDENYGYVRWNGVFFPKLCLHIYERVIRNKWSNTYLCNLTLYEICQNKMSSDQLSSIYHQSHILYVSRTNKIVNLLCVKKKIIKKFHI